MITLAIQNPDMKTRLIVIVSGLAVAILIIIQVYVIREYFRLKSRDFDIQYSYAVHQSLSDYDQFGRIFPFDSINYVFNHIAQNYLNQPDILADIANTDRQYIIYHDFLQVLYGSEKNTINIIRNLKATGLDTTFVSNYIINEIAFLDFDSIIPVYKREIRQLLSDKTDLKGFFIKNYTAEGDYYLIRFDYYVDFTMKGKIIIAEMKGLLILVIITTIAILLAFVFTINSFNKQKKLADLKGDFIDHITHEFKTPLSTISVAVSSLRLAGIRENAEQLDEITGMISKQNRYLSQMIDHVIETSQLDRNQLTLHKKEVKIKSFINEVIREFRLENQDKKFEINEKYSIDDGFVCFLDPLQFSRVLFNLLGNSVKYAEAKSVIDIHASANETLKIMLSDNGPGIDREDISEIFNKFYRGKREQAGKIKGLGLGLYLVKKIVESHEGTVEAESIPGESTTITIQLPINKEK
jgi:signal transduction histidine kinase